MNDLELLRQNKPAIAEFIKEWRLKYNRSFDLKDLKDQADFYEAVVEIGRHIAIFSDKAELNVEVSNQGISTFNIVI